MMPRIVGRSIGNKKAKKRRQEETDTADGAGNRSDAAKVTRLASALEEIKVEADVETQATARIEKILKNLLKDLWSDDKTVIVRALKAFRDIGFGDLSPFESELKIHELGGHTELLHVLQKHIGCVEIQQKAMCALKGIWLG
jgi:hypothetical protein